MNVITAFITSLPEGIEMLVVLGAAKTADAANALTSAKGRNRYAKRLYGLMKRTYGIILFLKYLTYVPG